MTNDREIFLSIGVKAYPYGTEQSRYDDELRDFRV
jgi:hypothetical protein